MCKQAREMCARGGKEERVHRKGGTREQGTPVESHPIQLSDPLCPGPAPEKGPMREVRR